MVPAQYEPSSGTFAVANIVYGLHTVSILAGLLTAGVTIVGAFIFSAPSILAVILNYIFRGDARGTYLANPNVLVCASLARSHLSHRHAACILRRRIPHFDCGSARSWHLGGLPNHLRLGEACSS